MGTEYDRDGREVGEYDQILREDQSMDSVFILGGEEEEKGRLNGAGMEKRESGPMDSDKAERSASAQSQHGMR